MIKTKRLYRHFKGNLYYVHDILKNSENQELIVSYQCLYGDYEMFSRPLSMFIEEVEPNRVDNITNQKYRFEIFEGIKVL